MEQYEDMSADEIQKLILSLISLRDQKQRKIEYRGVLKTDIYDSEVFFEQPYVAQKSVELSKIANAGETFIYEKGLWKRERDDMFFCDDIEDFLEVSKVDK